MNEKSVRKRSLRFSVLILICLGAFLLNSWFSAQLGRFSLKRATRHPLLTSTNGGNFLTLAIGRFSEELNNEWAKNNIDGSDECTTFEDQPQLEERFLHKCSYFLEQLQDWKMSAQAKKAEIIAWKQVSGAGDRLAGMISMFYYGMNVKKKMTVKWSNIETVFKPSCLMKEIFSTSSESSLGPQLELREGKQVGSLERGMGPRLKVRLEPGVDSSTCVRRTCNAGLSETDLCNHTDAHLVDMPQSIRACASKRTCSSMSQYYNNRASLTEVIGCPLRMLLEYTSTFLDSKIHYVLDGTVHAGTLRQLGKKLRQFKLVALHYRAGDRELISKKSRKIPSSILSSTTDCVNSVSRYLKSKSLPGDNRPVKWLVASDSENFRAFYRKEYPNDVIQLLIHPEHISKSNTSDPVHELVTTFQEFYLLSLADEMVINFKDERISAYSKFARLMSLKSKVYVLNLRGEKCVYKEMDFEGNTRPFPVECSANPLVGHSVTRKKYLPPTESLPQEHKKLL